MQRRNEGSVPMTHAVETVNMALFCDFENVALGVKDAEYPKFDLSLIHI